jgi:hypothetical protein
MTSLNSIAGNDGFTKVKNTVVSSNNVSNALQNASLMSFKTATGTVTPTAAGNYAVVAANGSNVTLPAGAIVTNVLLTGPDLLSGTSVSVYLSATAGGFSSSSLAANVALADLILGTGPPVVTVTGVVGEFLTLQAFGVFTAGTVTVTVLYL